MLSEHSYSISNCLNVPLTVVMFVCLPFLENFVVFVFIVQMQEWKVVLNQLHNFDFNKSKIS